MKPIKTFGLAAMAALMAMAFVGASSAMASTALCNQDSAGACASGHLITHLHQVTLYGAKAKLLSSITVECDVLFLGDTLVSLGATLSIHGNFTYTECGKSCEVEETSADALITIEKSAHEKAKVTGEGTVFVDCGSFLECEYDGEDLAAEAKGPLLSSEQYGEVKILNQVTHKTGGGFFCPKEAKLDIVTTQACVSPPTPVYIAE